jgi:hypothetical protein
MREEERRWKRDADLFYIGLRVQPAKKQANPEVGLFESYQLELFVRAFALLAVLASFRGFDTARMFALLAFFGSLGAAAAGFALGSRLLVFGLGHRDEGHCHGHNGQHFDELHTV